MALFLNADLTQHAHAREYRAAAEAVADQTPHGHREIAEGDWVSGRTHGKAWSGRVLIVEGDRLTIDTEAGCWLAVPAGDVTH